VGATVDKLDRVIDNHEIHMALARFNGKVFTNMLGYGGLSLNGHLAHNSAPTVLLCIVIVILCELIRQVIFDNPNGMDSPVNLFLWVLYHIGTLMPLC